MCVCVSQTAVDHFLQRYRLKLIWRPPVAHLIENRIHYMVQVIMNWAVYSIKIFYTAHISKMACDSSSLILVLMHRHNGDGKHEDREKKTHTDRITRIYFGTHKICLI